MPGEAVDDALSAGQQVCAQVSHILVLVYAPPAIACARYRNVRYRRDRARAHTYIYPRKKAIEPKGSGVDRLSSVDERHNRYRIIFSVIPRCVIK